VADEDRLAAWLAAEVCPVELREEALREAVAARCRAERIEPPGASRLNRVIGAGRAAAERDLCGRTVTRLPTSTAERLEALVTVGVADDAAGGEGALAELKADPGQVSLDTLLREVAKLARVRALALPEGLFADASDKVVAAWRTRAARAYPSDLRAAPRPVRLTLLAVLCWARTAEVTDALVDLLIALVLRINTKAERRVEGELLEDLRRVRGKEDVGPCQPSVMTVPPGSTFAHRPAHPPAWSQRGHTKPSGQRSHSR